MPMRSIQTPSTQSIARATMRNRAMTLSASTQRSDGALRARKAELPLEPFLATLSEDETAELVEALSGEDF